MINTDRIFLHALIESAGSAALGGSEGTFSFNSSKEILVESRFFEPSISRTSLQLEPEVVSLAFSFAVILPPISRSNSRFLESISVFRSDFRLSCIFFCNMQPYSTDVLNP